MLGQAAVGPRYVLDEHNIEYEILRRTAKSESGLVRRLYNAVNWRKLRSEELKAWRMFDGCSVTSAHDRDLLLRDLPDTRIAIVPNAVDLDYFRPRPDAPAPEPLSIIFFGAINYFPNSDGLSYFLEEIFPRVRTRLPGTKLNVVGHTPENLFALANDHIAMKGFVPDVRVEVERAAVVIAPLRIGGGTRLKILEAMAMGKPTVSTPQGAEGLEVTHDKELLLADTPAGFADQLVRALEDAALARRLGLAARHLVEQRYGWPASAARLEGLYDQIGAGR
jgi:glycosyltransferase involved in cell wall biosynthesis